MSSASNSVVVFCASIVPLSLRVTMRNKGGFQGSFRCCDTHIFSIDPPKDWCGRSPLWKAKVRGTSTSLGYRSAECWKGKK